MANDQSRDVSRGLAIYDQFAGNDYSDRERLAREIDARQPFPLRTASRITHMVRFYPSQADAFRNAIIQHAIEKDGGITSREIGEVESNAELRRMRIAFEIDALGRSASDQDSTGASKVYDLNSMNEACRSDIAGGGYPVFANEQIGKLKDLFLEGRPLHPTPQERRTLEAEWQSDADLVFAPFHPGGHGHRCWLNFWRYGRELFSSVGMRMYWETYGGNQNITIFEDSSRNAEMKSTEVLDTISPEAFHADGTINIHRTAIEAFDRHLSEVAPDNGFNWVGDLLMLANVWIVPAESAISAAIGNKRQAKRVVELLRRHFLREPLDEQPEHLQELRDTLQALSERYFADTDQTRLGRVDPFCAMARIADGRGFMMTDPVHRQLPGDTTPSKRIIIFDLAMTSEERGRIAKCICDLWTYQILAQRDYPYVWSIGRAITDVENALNELSVDFGKTSDQQIDLIEQGLDTTELSKEFDRIRNRLDRITAVLSATNYFLKDGVRGTADNARTMADLVKQRVAEMQVREFSSFRGLEALTSPFESTVSVMEDVSDRYQRCERRLTELTNLISGLQYRLHTETMKNSAQASQRLNHSAIRAAWTGASIAAIATLLTLYNSFKEDIAQLLNNVF